MKALIFSFFTIFLFGCQASEQITNPTPNSAKSDYLAFGSFHGFTAGRHSNIYKVDDSALYFDASDSYSLHGDSIFFSVIIPEHDKFTRAHELIALIPQQFLDTNNVIFGCPDCADQGGYYIEIKRDGKTHKFWIDTFTDPLPQYVKDFGVRVDSVLEFIGK